MHIGRKIRAILYAVLLCVFLAGCSFIDGSVSNLLKAPKPNNMQTSLADSINRNIGGGVKYVNPSSGNWTNSFNLIDLDSDGENEAVIFYSVPENSTDTPNVNMAVFKHLEDGSWEMTKDIEGNSSQIDYADFRDFDGDGYKDVLLGWIQNDNVKELCAYKLNDIADTPMFSDVYNQSRIFYRNGEMFILNIYKDESASKATAKISAVLNNALRTVAVCDIYGGYDTIESVVYDSVSESEKAIVIDSKTAGIMVTQIIRWDGKKLTNLYYSQENGISPQLSREIPYTSQDLDGDGIIEIPYSIALPSFPSSYEESGYQARSIIAWGSVNTSDSKISAGDALTRKFLSIMNTARNYYYEVPPEWVGKFTVAYYPADNSLTFFYVSGEERSKMFTLYTLTEEQYLERENQGTWFELRKKQSRVYALNMAPNLTEDIAGFIGNIASNRERLVLTK